MIIPVILAGGEGTRLWPLSNTKTPKQFLSVFSNNFSFYQSTVQRVLRCVPTRTAITVTSAALSPQVQAQFQRFAPRCRNHIIQEPYGRNTAAAVTLAVLYAQEKFGEEALLWVTPADHVIKQPARLKQAVERAIPYAWQGNIITFGIRPTHPDSNYGYIVTHDEKTPVLNVRQFIEKPPLETIHALPHASYFWNSGMFVFSVATFLAEMEHYDHALLHTLKAAYRQGNPLPSGHKIHPSSYDSIPSLPLDKVIMEHSKRLKTIPTQMGWRDIGSWQSLWEFTRENRYGSINSPLKDTGGSCGNCLAYLNRRFAFNEL